MVCSLQCSSSRTLNGGGGVGGGGGDDGADGSGALDTADSSEVNGQVDGEDPRAVSYGSSNSGCSEEDVAPTARRQRRPRAAKAETSHSATILPCQIRNRGLRAVIERAVCSGPDKWLGGCGRTRLRSGRSGLEYQTRVCLHHDVIASEYVEILRAGWICCCSVAPVLSIPAHRKLQDPISTLLPWHVFKPHEGRALCNVL